MIDWKVYCLKCRLKMEYNGEGRGPLYKCIKCDNEVEVEVVIKK